MISIKKGLNQGDPLVYFLFLLVLEGLSSPLKKAISFNVIKSFKMGYDGMVVVGVPSVEDLVTIKVVLKRFELLSVLKVTSLGDVCLVLIWVGIWTRLISV